jgi:hypothetical protein
MTTHRFAPKKRKRSGGENVERTPDPFLILFERVAVDAPYSLG